MESTVLQIVFFGPAGLVLVVVWGGGGGGRDKSGVGLPWIHLWKYGYNHNFLGSNVNNMNSDNNGIVLLFC